MWELGERLTDEPEGTSIRGVVEELGREKLIVIRRDDPRLVSSRARAVSVLKLC